MPIDISKLTIEEVLDLKAQLNRVQIGKTVNGHHQRKPSKAREKWEALDWTKSNKQLAGELGVCSSYISLWRGKFGKPKVTKYSSACHTWDWSLSDTQIARNNKVGVGTVQYYRVKLNKPPAPRDYVSPIVEVPKILTETVDWKAVDWNLPDIELARKHGVTRERVRQIRAKLGIPKSLFTNIKLKRFKEWVGDRKSLRWEDAKDSGLCCNETFKQYCARLGITRLRSRQRPLRLPWDKVNFDLPNALLQDIWGFSYNGVANHRCNHHLKKSAFHSVRKKYPSEWQPIIEAERKKADEYRSAKNHGNNPCFDNVAGA